MQQNEASMIRIDDLIMGIEFKVFGLGVIA